ncbi:hypothetical protein FLTE109939_13310 [Flavobacterium terrigena]
MIDVVSNAGAVPFKQILAIAGNVGTIIGSIVIFIVVPTPHCPGLGVNVYVVIPAVLVLIVAGLQIPVMLLFEVANNVGAVAF